MTCSGAGTRNSGRSQNEWKRNRKQPAPRLFGALAVHGNPVDGVKRPTANSNEGSTPAIGDAQARKLLDAPPEDTLKGVRDRAILATLLYHGLRCEELCRLRLRDLHSRQGVMHFRVHGKRSKLRFIPMHVTAHQLIEEYVALAGHGSDPAAPVFRPVTNNRSGTLDRPLDPDSVYHNIVHKYGRETGLAAQVKLKFPTIFDQIWQ